MANGLPLCCDDGETREMTQEEYDDWLNAPAPPLQLTLDPLEELRAQLVELKVLAA